MNNKRPEVDITCTIFGPRAEDLSDAELIVQRAAVLGLRWEDNPIEIRIRRKGQPEKRFWVDKTKDGLLIEKA